MSERTIDYHGVMVTPETAHRLNMDSLVFGAAYLKRDGTRIPAWTMHGFKEEPFVEMPRPTIDLFSDDPALD